MIRSATKKGNEATVMVASRITSKATTARQTEIYRLVLTERGWKLLDLQVQHEIIEEPAPVNAS